jgi:hypothetical protein
MQNPRRMSGRYLTQKIRVMEQHFWQDLAPLSHVQQCVVIVGGHVRFWLMFGRWPTRILLWTPTILKNYCKGFYQRVARQQLSKHFPKCNNESCVSVENFSTSLLGKSQRVNGLPR